MSDKTAAERLRDLLDELNIKHFDYDKGGRTQTQWEAPDGNRHFTYETYDNPARTAKLVISWFPTPEQAIAATLGNDGVERSKNGAATEHQGASERIKSVYLVMVSDDLLEDGMPLCAYLDVPSAEQRASRERCVDEDGVRHYAWVTEVKVVDE